MDWRALVFVSLLFFFMAFTMTGFLYYFLVVGGALLFVSFIFYWRKRVRFRSLSSEAKMLERARGEAEQFELLSQLLLGVGAALVILGFYLLFVRRVSLGEYFPRVVEWFPYWLPALLSIASGAVIVFFARSFASKARRARVTEAFAHTVTSGLVTCPKCNNQYNRIFEGKCPNCGEPTPAET